MSVIALLGKETTPPRRQQDVIAYVIARLIGKETIAPQGKA
jgi:hypothetical protein